MRAGGAEDPRGRVVRAVALGPVAEDPLDECERRGALGLRAGQAVAARERDPRGERVDRVRRVAAPGADLDEAGLRGERRSQIRTRRRVEDPDEGALRVGQVSLLELELSDAALRARLTRGVVDGAEDVLGLRRGLQRSLDVARVAPRGREGP